MEKKKIRGKIRYVLAGTAVAACALACVFFWPHPASKGEKYIEEQEQKPVEELLPTLEQRRSEEVKRLSESGQLSIFDLFDSYAILGDSRAVRFAQTLDPEKVMADIGVRITNIDNYVDRLQSMQPKTIYIMYGLNDIQSNLNGMEGGYGKIVDEELGKIEEACPNSKIVVIGILPVQGDEGMNAQIAVYNEILREQCEKNGWTYLDGSDLATSEYFEQDGEHFIADFYPRLAQRMIEVSGQ